MAARKSGNLRLSLRALRGVWIAVAMLVTGVARADDPVMVLMPLIEDDLHDLPPRIEGHRVVWQHDVGAASEIYLYDGITVGPLATNGVADEAPSIDGPWVVWQQWDGDDWELIRYDIEVDELRYLTNNDTDDTDPSVGSAFVAFVSEGVLSDEIFLYSAGQIDQLSGDEAEDHPPEMVGASFVWVKGSAIGTDVFAWLPEYPGGGGIFQISGATNETPDVQPVVSGSRVAWVSGSGSSEEIWRLDPTPGREYLVQVTNNNLRDRNPKMVGDLIVWEHFDGNDYEIYTWSEGQIAPVPLTNNGWDDYDVQLSHRNLVWIADQQPGDTELWMSWSLGTPFQLTDDDQGDYDPVIDNRRIAWRKCNPTECDVWTAPEPGAVAIALAALAALHGLRRTFSFRRA